jgi:hypothetical protein
MFRITTLAEMMLARPMHMELLLVTVRSAARLADEMLSFSMLLQRVLTIKVGVAQMTPMMHARCPPMCGKSRAMVEASITFGAKWVDGVVMGSECGGGAEESLAANAIWVGMGVMIVKVCGVWGRVNALFTLNPAMYIYVMIHELVALVEVVLAGGAQVVVRVVHPVLIPSVCAHEVPLAAITLPIRHIVSNEWV